MEVHVMVCIIIAVVVKLFLHKHHIIGIIKFVVTLVPAHQVVVHQFIVDLGSTVGHSVEVLILVGKRCIKSMPEYLFRHGFNIIE